MMARFFQKIISRVQRIFIKNKNEVVAYRAHENGVVYIKSVSNADGEAQDLPKSLIVAPGLYAWKKKIFYFENEGLYRLILPEKMNLQRIVFQGNIIALLSSISWMISHGGRDDKKTNLQLLQIGKNDKLYITCERSAQFGNFILQGLGLKSRVVCTEKAVFSDSYDCGHVMLEVFLALEQQWVLFDLDRGVYFKKKDKLLSFLDFIRVVKTTDYGIAQLSEKVSLDVSGFQSSRGFNYHFLMEGVIADLKRWYQTVCQVAIILDDNKRYYYASNCQHAHINNIPLTAQQFELKFYGSE